MARVRCFLTRRRQRRAVPTSPWRSATRQLRWSLSGWAGRELLRREGVELDQGVPGTRQRQQEATRARAPRLRRPLAPKAASAKPPQDTLLEGRAPCPRSPSRSDLRIGVVLAPGKPVGNWWRRSRRARRVLISVHDPDRFRSACLPYPWLSRPCRPPSSWRSVNRMKGSLAARHADQVPVPALDPQIGPREPPSYSLKYFSKVLVLGGDPAPTTSAWPSFRNHFYPGGCGSARLVAVAALISRPLVSSLLLPKIFRSASTNCAGRARSSRTQIDATNSSLALP